MRSAPNASPELIEKQKADIRYMFGPRRSDFKKVREWCHMEPAEVAEKMGITLEEYTAMEVKR